MTVPDPTTPEGCYRVIRALNNLPYLGGVRVPLPGDTITMDELATILEQYGAILKDAAKETETVKNELYALIVQRDVIRDFLGTALNNPTR